MWDGQNGFDAEKNRCFSHDSDVPTVCYQGTRVLPKGNVAEVRI